MEKILLRPITLILFCIFLIASCGGGSGGSSISSSSSDDTTFSQTTLENDAELTGSGVKGPLAHAQVKVFSIDPTVDDFYDSSSPIAIGDTDANAAIQNLSIPQGTLLPLILEIDGANSTDLIINQRPAISKLITVVTAKQLSNDIPVYATPLSTLTFRLASNLTQDKSVSSFLSELNRANNITLSVFNFGLNSGLNTFLTPPLINNRTTTVSDQRIVADYRAANEGFAAVVHNATNNLKSEGYDVNEDQVLNQIALDLHSDLLIDNKDNDNNLSYPVDTDLITENALNLRIPKSDIRIRDISNLLKNELELGNTTSTFLIDDYTPPVTTATLKADIDNDGILNFSDNRNNLIDSGNGRLLLNVNFENHSVGPYSESNARIDFLVGSQGYNDDVNGPGANEAVDIVNDPAGSGRGKVMRVLHHGGVGGGSTREEGGMRWRADLPPADEYYFSYEVYLPNDWHDPHQVKMPGLINGTLLEATHAGGVVPHPDTLAAFTALMQMDRSDTGSGRPDYSVHGYYYDKDRVQRSDWLNTIDPTSEAREGQYVMPKGRWVKIEQYIKLNTVNQRDGKLKIWMDGELMLDEDHRWRADLSYPDNEVSNADRQIDGIMMYSYYGGNPNDPRNREHDDQYHYFDNFIVSDSPITH